MAKNGTKLSSAVVVTVLNEHDNISELLDALKFQKLAPEEVIIIDGGSSDGTWNQLTKCAAGWKKLKIYQLPKSNRSVARNFGVSKSRSQIIAFTDAGCIPHVDWLMNLVSPFKISGTNVVSGYYRGIAHNNFQKCLIPYCLVMPDKAKKQEFFPATRSMGINRETWNKSGGFDPNLYHNEDYAFAHWLKKMGLNFHFADNAIVDWYPRKNLSQALGMFFHFAVGDIQAGIVRPNIKLLLIRYLIGLYLLVLAIEIKIIFVLLFLLLLIYSGWAITKNYKYVNNISALFWLPVIQFSSDLAIIWGTIIGGMSKIYL
jgi:glycosyltransferase involved in cell wall biosynthesis